MRSLLKLAGGVAREYRKRSLRSNRWPEVRRAYLKEHGSCVACGSTVLLQVHHKKPFHLYPELELDPSNFITLCQWNLCHLYLGHGDSWDCYVPDIVDFAEQYLVASDGYRKELIGLARTGKLR